MNDLKRSQHRGFGKRILTDSTAVFRLKDIESSLGETDRARQKAPPAPPAIPAPAMPAADKQAQRREPVQAAPLVDLSALDESTRTDIGGEVRPSHSAQKIVFLNPGRSQTSDFSRQIINFGFDA